MGHSQISVITHWFSIKFKKCSVLLIENIENLKVQTKPRKDIIRNFRHFCFWNPWLSLFCFFGGPKTVQKRAPTVLISNYLKIMGLSVAEFSSTCKIFLTNWSVSCVIPCTWGMHRSVYGSIGSRGSTKDPLRFFGSLAVSYTHLTLPTKA